MKSNMKMKFIATLVLSLTVTTLTVGCFSCGGRESSDVLNDVVSREDFTSVYSKIGTQVSVDGVREDENGLAYATVDGKEYELGMDFLSMAMVYNVRPVGRFTTSEDVYNEWWRLFMQRWNYLVPEAPLYSNQYYDVYNGKIDKLQTNPYWDVADAIISATVSTLDNSVILGANTELTGMFRNASFGKSSPGAADADIESLTSGYQTVTTDESGSFVWAGTQILRSHEERENQDGTKTFEIEIADGLQFSDGTPIRAEHYLVSTLVGSTPVMAEAGGGESAGLAIVGFEQFNEYKGGGQPVPFKGLRLLGTHRFSVTVKKEYADYYYALRYGAFAPAPLDLYLGDCKIKDDGEGAYIEECFYQKTEKNGVNSYLNATMVSSNMS